MNMARFPFAPPQQSCQRRGAAPVGTLADLPVLEQGAMLLMRQWCSDEAGRCALAHGSFRALGDGSGQLAVDALDHLITLFVHHGRRPIMRHDLTCTRLGGDESAFAQLVAAASAGDTEDAIAF